MSPQPLPPEYSVAPFTVAGARDSGITDKRMRGLDLDRSVWGIRLPPPQKSDALSSGVARRCVAYALRMPDHAFFSHSTAALLLHAPLPLRHEQSATLHISVPRPSRAPHAAGIRGHKLEVEADHLTMSLGLVHTTPARTWCDLASVLSLHDLVAVGDYLTHWRQPLTSMAELHTVSRTFAGKRGMATIRQALPLISDRAESRPESILRVILELAGLPRPRVNYEIVHTDEGTRVRTDLAFDEFMMVVEYQGDYHRSKEQWRKDMTRRSRLEARGWFVMELNADDLRDPHELAARIRSVLRTRGWRG